MSENLYRLVVSQFLSIICMSFSDVIAIAFHTYRMLCYSIFCFLRIGRYFRLIYFATKSVQNIANEVKRLNRVTCDLCDIFRFKIVLDNCWIFHYIYTSFIVSWDILVPFAPHILLINLLLLWTFTAEYYMEQSLIIYKSNYIHYWKTVPKKPVPFLTLYSHILLAHNVNLYLVYATAVWHNPMAILVARNWGCTWNVILN